MKDKTSFIYIADTHLGAQKMGFQQQIGYPQKLPEIISALKQFIADRGDIDFILHGGDMVDHTSKKNVISAKSLFELSVPVYLCLGNHDLTEPDALNIWLRNAPEFFMQTNKATFSIKKENCIIHIFPNQWCDEPYYWKDMLHASFSDSQKEQLHKSLSICNEIPHILIAHSPVFGLPTEQTGFDKPFHSPNKSFTEELIQFSIKYPNLKCILGAHNHLNMCVLNGGAKFITVSSLVETPFEFKLFEIHRNQISMETISLVDSLKFKGEYNIDRSFVQGRNIDRSFLTLLN